MPTRQSGRTRQSLTPAASGDIGRDVAPRDRLPASGLGLLLVLLLSVSAVWAGDAATVCFDFETGDLQGWTIVEGSFGKVVCDRAEYHHYGGAYNKEGTFFLSTLESPDNRPDDHYVGVVESPVFVPVVAEMTMLVGGGNHGDTYVGLCTLDGTVVRKGQGVRDQKMQRVRWEVQEVVGKPVFLRIVDRNKGGWGHTTFDDFSVRGRLDPAATLLRQAEAEKRRRLARLREEIRSLRLAPLREAVLDLAASFPRRYSRGAEFLARVDECRRQVTKLEQDMARAEDVDSRLPEALAARVRALRREALLANPLVCSHPILFVVRHQYRSDHHNTATLFQTGECNTGSFQGGGALKALDVSAAGRTRTLLELPEGVVRDPEVHFDGRRIVFSMRRNVRDDYHVYEIGADGSDLRQLTSAPGVADVDPLYLPDDTIVFSSSREPKYCMCNRHIMANLFRMSADGANIHQIGKSTLFEGHGALLSDGRILYDRWEYVDRNFGDAQGLWTVNPDGTNHAVYWGNNTASPGGVIDARAIPGTQRVVCVFGSCHDRPWGALTIVDRRLGLDGRGPVVRTWPESAIDRVDRGNWDAFVSVKPKYEDPFPLFDPNTPACAGTYFLCSRMLDSDAEAAGARSGEQMGIYLVDVFGNELLLHTEAPGCFDPMLLATVPRPPVIPSRREFRAVPGRFLVADVYRGTHMAGVERGTVKALRIVESPEKRFWTVPAWGGQGVHRPAMNWLNFENKRILGTVPVEADGSAYFGVPSGRFVFFQLLDANGMMVQSMRSGTMAQPGETTGCVGCHEGRLEAPPPATVQSNVLAAQHPPSPLDGWYGPPRTFSYMAEVQPVFTRHCVRCHDYGKPAGVKLNLAGDRSLTFNASYTELWRRKAITCVGAGPAAIRPARSWGSHASKLVQLLRGGKMDVELTKEEMDRIVTWVDINAPYYPTYASAYPRNLGGRSPLDGGQIKRLTELTGVPLAKLAAHGASRGPQVSFDRPALSPCLSGLPESKSAQAAEAVAIIKAGRATLADRPRADMPGFEACEEDRKRQAWYAARSAIEERNWLALRTGGRVYDGGEAGADGKAEHE